MTGTGEFYLAIVLAAFSTFSVALFWEMLTSDKRPGEIDQDGRQSSL
jgi:hypothetical protein